MIQSVCRRSLLTGLAATGVFAMLEGTAMAAPKKSFFSRVGLPIGLQLYTLGDEVARDLDATFAKVAALGYRDIELPQLYGRTPADIRAAADRAGLAITSLHLALSTKGFTSGLSLASDSAQIADSLGALGATWGVAPIMLFPDNWKAAPGETFQAAIGRAMVASGPDIWKRTAALLNEKAAVLKPLGIRTGYHNHNLEFAPLGKTTGWEILLAETDPALISLEVDIGWVAAAGLDPVAFLERHRGRVSHLHVKDLKPGKPANFALSMDPSEVGAGKQDWARILPAALKAGARHFYVEQEPPFAIPRMEAIKRSHDFLAGLKA